MSERTEDLISNVNENNDWREEENGQSHLGRFSYLLESGLFSDFEFIVGLNKERIKAHKIVLKIGSPIFEATLREGGSGDAPTKELNIPDIEPEYFKIFLKYLYTGDCTLVESSRVIPLLRAAKTYKVPDLIRICAKSLETAVTENTALTIFRQAVEYEEKDLEEKAIQHICKFAFRIVDTSGFLELSSDLLEKLVCRDDLAVYDETQLFEALVRWAEAECRRHGTVVTNKYQRSFLESLIPFIRFPQITPSEFSLKVASREILLMEEVVSVLLYYNVPGAQRSTAATNTKFNLSPRDYYVCATNCTLERLKSLGGTIKITNTWHRICFKADTPVWMTSVGLNKVDLTPTNTCPRCQQLHYMDSSGYCSWCENYSLVLETSSSYMVEVRVEDYNLESIFAKKRETVLKENNTSAHYQIKFDKPVKILPNTWYTASLRVEGSYTGQNYNEPPGSYGIQGTSGGGFANFEFKNPKEIDLDNQTSIDGGQMAELGFHIPS